MCFMENKIKEVSIVLCTYNGEKYLREQLDTLIDQTYPIKEIIIQDDCSTDSTFFILQEYADKYHIIKLFKNLYHKNINENFFSAMEKATGDYIAISDQDDIWELNKIEEQVKTIGDNLLSFCYTNNFYYTIDNLSKPKVHNYDILRMLFVGCIAGHTMLIKKDLLYLCPNKEVKSLLLYDHLLQIMASLNNSISFCKSTCVYHRRYIGAATYDKEINYNIIISIIRTLRQYTKTKPYIINHLNKMKKILLVVPGDNEVKNKAFNLIYYFTNNDFINNFRKSLFCLKYRDCLFFSNDNNRYFRLLRSLYFPISCSDYFRYLLHD